MEHFIDGFRRFADFSGRATREQFWMFFLFYIVACVVLSILDAFLGMQVLSTIFLLAIIVPSWAYGARRLHDIGRSGWWQLIVLIPLIGIIVLIVFWAQPSQGDNRFGPGPAHAVNPTPA